MRELDSQISKATGYILLNGTRSEIDKVIHIHKKQEVSFIQDSDRNLDVDLANE